MAYLSLGLLTTVIRRGLPLAYVVGADWLVHGRWADCWTRGLDGRPPSAGRLARLLAIPPAPPPPALAASGTFLFVSEFTRRRAERVAGLAMPDVRIIPAGIDWADFPPAAPRKRPWRWRLLCVGRLDRTKGFDLVVRALVELPSEATLTIVGGVGSHGAELAELARRLGVAERLRWERRERSELAGRYRSADALIFPSRGTEAFGLVPLEAMACGTPVVATGAGGSVEFLAHEENCLLVAPERPTEIAAALSRLAADDELRRRLALGGVATALRFGVDRQATALEEAHLAVAEAASARARAATTSTRARTAGRRAVLRSRSRGLRVRRSRTPRRPRS